MDHTALKSEIESGPLAAELASFVAVGNDAAITTALNAPRFTAPVSPTMANARYMMANMDPMLAAGILDKLEAAAAVNSAVKWAMRFITGDGIDVGHKNTRAMLDQLAAAGVLTAAESEAVKALGVRPVSRAMLALGTPVSPADVAIALRGEG